ncbi:hypothetical protein V8C43DRAFT_328375 [Trichoderma afarasin]
MHHCRYMAPHTVCHQRAVPTALGLTLVPSTPPEAPWWLPHFLRAEGQGQRQVPSHRATPSAVLCSALSRLGSASFRPQCRFNVPVLALVAEKKAAIALARVRCCTAKASPSSPHASQTS